MHATKEVRPREAAGTHRLERIATISRVTGPALEARVRGAVGRSLEGRSRWGMSGKTVGAGALGLGGTRAKLGVGRGSAPAPIRSIRAGTPTSAGGEKAMVPSHVDAGPRE